MTGAAALSFSPSWAGNAKETAIAALEKQSGGLIGFAAVDLGSGRRIAHRADQRFALCSTFKWVLAASVLHEIDLGRLSGETILKFGPDDLAGYAPFADQIRDNPQASILQWAKASVEMSDNVGANLLLRALGGPAKVTEFIRAQHDPVTRLDRDEPELNSNIPEDLRDTTSPNAMVGLLQQILLGNSLQDESRETLLDWMRNCQTGHSRLRAGVPAGWVVADKTGTGTRGAVNDVAILFPPSRKPILIASYLSGSTRSTEELNKVHARLAALTVTQFT